MGLIKKGLVLAGGYGLVKSTSKTVKEHDERQQQFHYNQQHYDSGCPHAYQHTSGPYMNNQMPQSQTRFPDGAQMNYAQPMSAPPSYNQAPYNQAHPVSETKKY